MEARTLTYEIRSNLAGAPRLDLTLTVDKDNKLEKGTAELTQPVSPPLDMKFDNVRGDFFEIEKQIFAHMANDPTRPGEANLVAALVVPKWGDPGEASYYYTDARMQKHYIGPVKAIPIRKHH